MFNGRIISWLYVFTQAQEKSIEETKNHFGLSELFTSAISCLENHNKFNVYFLIIITIISIIINNNVIGKVKIIL